MTETNKDLTHDSIPGPEDIRDPLDDLIARTEADPGAPFAPEVLHALKVLQQDDRTRYEDLRHRLKHAGCRITALDKSLKDLGRNKNSGGGKQVDQLIELAREADLFHCTLDVAYADVQVNGHRETWQVRSKGFRHWLTRRYYEATGGAPGSEALNSALSIIEARSCFEGPQREVHLRVGELNGKLYIDLCNDVWSAVEIGNDGWEVIGEPPVCFRRTPGMQALPMPEPGGSIELLRQFLNVRRESDFVLVVAWALAALRNRGPYPVLVLTGEQGAAKSTFTAMLRSLVDPNTASIRALPRADHEFFIAASNGHVLAYDNLSRLTASVSDTLCRLSTGGGLSVRQLYSDQEEVLFEATRAVILNGIEEVVTRSDLADRSLFLELEAIPEEHRRPENELWSGFNAARPKILGTLLDAVSHGLMRLPDTQLDRLPRLADFAIWATACETALWSAGTFGAAYSANRDEAIDDIIEASPVASGICSLMTTRVEWAGTATGLLKVLNNTVNGGVRNSKGWPKGPQALSGYVRRVRTSLRKIGIEIDFDRVGHGRTRTIRIFRKVEGAVKRPSTSSASCESMQDSRKNNDLNGNAQRTVIAAVDVNTGHREDETVRINCCKNNGIDVADGADATARTFSGLKKMDVSIMQEGRERNRQTDGDSYPASE
ncbi:MAG: hypothetical protein AB2552_21270 [Candidatus Thiodiazotropha endolucinida]